LGKATAQNAAVDRAKGELLLFTDAEVCLAPDAVRHLARHFDTDAVGCVVGKVQYVNGDETCVSEGETAYWRYELFLRQAESDLGILAMASGSIMAVRRALFQPLDPAVSEDFVLPITLAMRGYKTVYEPAAIARVPLFQVQPRDMLHTKARTITLDTRGLFLCRGILNPLRYPLYSWGLISHKLLRWLVPYFLFALFAVNLLLLHHPFYRFTLVAQVVCYGLAGVGYLWQRSGRKPPLVLGIPFSFCLVNAAAAVGVARFLMGKKAGRWQPVR
jgi:cellulose synthase/poly-beta-1,6-N-acetylglucosamine synthase-like glycosyltransferase